MEAGTQETEVKEEDPKVGMGFMSPTIALRVHGGIGGR